MRLWLLAATAAALTGLWGAVDNLAASGPVPRTLTGCVSGGVFYSIHEEASPAGPSSPVVYRINMQDLDLRPCEGKKIRIQGYLLPGDRFIAEKSSLQELGACDTTWKKAIKDRGVRK